MTDSMLRDQCYRHNLWAFLVECGTPEAMEHELAKFGSEGYATYQAPLKPWVKSLLGRNYIFRTRKPGTAAGLVASLVFISDVMHLFLMQTCEEESSEQENVAKLMQEFAKQDPEGPWADKSMTEDVHMIDALTAILSHIHVFLPNHLFMAHNITVSYWSWLDYVTPCLLRHPCIASSQSSNVDPMLRWQGI